MVKIKNRSSCCLDLNSDLTEMWFFRFIEKYGTHIIVGVQMGGKDVVHIKQSKKSDLPQTEVQKLLKELADERFSGASNQSSNVNLADKARKHKV